MVGWRVGGAEEVRQVLGDGRGGTAMVSVSAVQIKSIGGGTEWEENGFEAHFWIGLCCQMRLWQTSGRPQTASQSGSSL